MDSLTHIVLGACIGEALAGKQLGKKAMLMGAIANSFPDIDIVASFWQNTTSNLLAHRGITHSFFFLLLVSPLLAGLSGMLFRKNKMPFTKWWFFWGLQMFIHLLIDSFTAYGTGWFEPFSHYRVSFNAIFVLDPLFTIGPLIAFIALLILKHSSVKRMKWAVTGIALCIAYTGYSFVNKAMIDHKTQQAFAAKHIQPTTYFTTPTPLNNLLWYVVARTDSGYYIGYRSILDKKEGIDFRYIHRYDSLLQFARDKQDLNNLLRFSQGYYTAEMKQDSLIFNDLRFGEIGAWSTAHPKFVFYFYLQHPSANDMIVQRGRIAMADKKSLKAFVKRIVGR